MKSLITNGFSLVIYANQLMRATYPAVIDVAKSILKKSKVFEVEKNNSNKKIISLV